MISRIGAVSAIQTNFGKYSPESPIQEPKRDITRRTAGIILPPEPPIEGPPEPPIKWPPEPPIKWSPKPPIDDWTFRNPKR